MKKIFFLLITVISFFVISNFLTSIYTLWHKKDLLIIANNQLQREEADNAKLKQQLAKVKGKDFIEEQARDRLFMVRPSESEIIIPASALHLLPSTKSISQTYQKPNWQRWLGLFFY